MIYWLILISIILFQIIRKQKKTSYLNMAFYIFIAGAVFKIISLDDLSEILMRGSFIFFLVGLVLSYLEKDNL